MSEKKGKRGARAEYHERHSKITRRMWRDEKFCALTKPQPNGQSFWQWLLTGPHNTNVPGLFVMGTAAMAEALGWPYAETVSCLSEVTERGMVSADQKTKLIWVRKALVHNLPPNPNVILGWLPTWRELPECALRDEARVEMRKVLASASEKLAVAFDKATEGTARKGFPLSAGATAGNGYGKQEQEQEQEYLSRIAREGRLTDEEESKASASGKVVLLALRRHASLEAISNLDVAHHIASLEVSSGKKLPELVAGIEQAAAKVGAEIAMGSPTYAVDVAKFVSACALRMKISASVTVLRPGTSIGQQPNFDQGWEDPKEAM